jgi:hypothetical protein
VRLVLAARTTTFTWLAKSVGGIVNPNCYGIVAGTGARFSGADLESVTEWNKSRVQSRHRLTGRLRQELGLVGDVRAVTVPP